MPGLQISLVPQAVPVGSWQPGTHCPSLLHTPVGAPHSASDAQVIGILRHRPVDESHSSWAPHRIGDPGKTQPTTQDPDSQTAIGALQARSFKQGGGPPSEGVGPVSTGWLASGQVSTAASSKPESRMSRVPESKDSASG